MATPQIKAFYNEINPHCCAMLQRLMDDGLITAGKIDDRPIQDIRPEDVAGYDRVHWFAGIGGWDVALNLANWTGGFVWTGSCPCQPFSTAGKQKGHSDERHLWPHWARLIRECRPTTIFGEQVAGAVTFGWWDDVADDLEAEGYACAAAVLPACSVGKPHKRDRLWFVANSELRGCERQPQQHSAGVFGALDGSPESRKPTSAYGSSTLANSESERGGGASGTGGSEIGRPTTDDRNKFRGASLKRSTLADTTNINSDERGRSNHSCAWRHNEGEARTDSSFHWLACPDGKQRPVEPGICLLAHGVQHRAPLLHGYGNAIVPQVAAEFIKATFRGNQ